MNDNKLLTRTRLKDFPTICFCNKVFIKPELLSAFFYIPSSWMQSWILDNVSKKSTMHIDSSYWIDVNLLISNTTSVHVPGSLQLLSLYFAKNQDNKVRYDNVSYLFKALEIHVNNNDAFQNVVDLWMKICPKKMISVEAYARSTSIFEFLSGLTTVTSRERFYLYYNFLLNSEPDGFPSFITHSFTSFNNKYFKFVKSGAQVFFHENNGNNFAQKQISKEDRELILDLYQNGVRYSYRHISRFVNTARILRGAKPISLFKVINLIKNGDDYSKLYFKRNGKESINAVIYHPGRGTVQHPGTLYQIDGTRLNILYKDSNNEIGFLNLTVAIDIYSRRIVSHILSKTENFVTYKTIILESLKNTGFLPAEILTDNLPALNSRVGIIFFSKLKRLGVYCRKHSKLNPSDKGHVETWFGTFSDLYLKDVIGYLGDGITSKNKDGKPNSDLKEKYRKKTNIMSRFDLEFLIDNKIKEYNASYNYNNSHPNQLFWDSKASKSIPITRNLFPYLAFVEKEKFINKLGFKLQSKGFYYDYCFSKDNLEIFKGYLHQKVIVRYNPDDMKSVYIYDDDVIRDYKVELKLNEKLPPAHADQTELHKQKWKIFSKDRYDLKKKLVQSSFGDTKKKPSRASKALPLESMLYTKDSKEAVANAESKYLLNGIKEKIIFKKLFRVKK